MSEDKILDSLSFDGKNLLAGVGLLALVFLVGGVMAQAQSVPDVAVNSNGVTINTGSLDVQGNDIEDAGTTLYDAASGEIPDAVLGIDLSTNAGNDLTWDSNNEVFNVDSSTIQSGTTASDVGLGNVENIELSTIGGNDLTWDATNSELDVDSSTIQSGTTASDVGLGNADNADELDLDGSESMNGDLDLGSNYLLNTLRISDSSDSQQTSNNYIQLDDGGSDFDMGSESTSTSQFYIRSNDLIKLIADSDGDGHSCTLEEDTGDWVCDGSKSWSHNLGNGSEAVYTSQESPEVRAVYEGQTTVENGEVTVDLPSHFEKTVSDTEPMLRVQATPQELATVAVTERSDSSLTIEASKDVTVDYRVTGIREGYEDKQVVREKE